MNKVFRIIWNRTLGRLVVASEAARSQGKSGVEHLQVAPMVVINTPPMGRLRPLVLAIGLAAAGTITPAAIAQDATYDNVTVNNQLVVSETAILSALEVSGSAAFDGPLTVGGVSVATASDIDGLDTRVGVNEAAITVLDGRVDANETAITGLDGRVDANESAIAAASAGWDISAEGNAGENVAPGGAVDFSGDGNIEVGRDGTNLTFSLADEIEVASVSAGNVTLGTSGLTISGGPSVTSGGIDAGGQRITNVEAGDLSAGSTDAVIGSQIFDLFIEEGAGGVRYFRARSAQPDSEALGDESIAIGPSAKTTEMAAGAIALGEGATAGTEDGAVDDGEGSIAIGRDSQASGTRTLALGDSAAVEDERVEDAMALGTGAVVSGMESDRALAAGFEANASAADATAVGASASASGGSSTALGAGSSASGGSSISLGSSEAMGGNSIAAGVNAVAGTSDSIALGTNAGRGTGTEINEPGQRNSHIAIGKDAGRGIDGNQSIAIGVNAARDAVGSNHVAIGAGAAKFLEGERNVALGYLANANEEGEIVKIDHATSIGGLSRASTDGVSVGYGAVSDTSSVALGAGARARDGSVALGHNSFADEVSGTSYLTGSFYEGPAVSVGNSETELRRRIVNLEDGSDDYDAVNVRQLEALKNTLGSFEPESGGNVNYNDNGTITVVAAQAGDQAVNFSQLNARIAAERLNFYSVNPNGDAANKAGDGALGDDSANSMAIGHGARVDASQRASALGYRALVKGDDGTAMGSGSIVNDASGVAIGNSAYSRGANSLALGSDAQTEEKTIGQSVDNAIAIGTSSRATDNSSTALGHQATASGERSSALGRLANAQGVDSMAFGTRSNASGVRSQASGTDASASGVNAQASGTDASASGSSSIATGTDASGYASDGIAMGTGAQSGLANPLPEEEFRNTNGIAIGNSSLADNRNALALGVEAQAREESSTALGDSAEATAIDALAVGSSARSTAESAAALGKGAEATHERSVALGAGSITSAPIGTSGATIDKVEYTYAGTDPVATVSVGSEGEERTITNVAAGRVSAASTDAINGSQLHGTNMALEALADDLDTAGASVADVLGGNAAYDPETHQLTTSNVGGTDEDTVHDAIEYAAQGWDISANGADSENVAPGGSVDFSNTDDNIVIARDGTDLTFGLSDELEIASSITVGDTVIDGDSLATSNLDVGGGTFVVEGDNVTYGGNEVATQADGLSFAGNTGGTIDKALGDSAPLTISGDLAAGEASSGANLRVDSDGNQLNLVMARNLTDLDSIIINDGPVIDSAGVTIGGVKLDGSGLTIAGGPSVTNAGINAGDQVISNVAPGVDGSDAVNVDQLGEVRESVNRSWNVSANGEDEPANVAPDGTVDFASSDENIVITRDGTDLDFALADDLTGLESIGLNGIDGADGLTIRGGDGAPGLDGEDGTTRIIYEDADGTPYQVATMDDGLVFAGNTGDDIARKLGETLTISGGLEEGKDATGANLRVDSDGNQLNLVMARNLTDLDSIIINDGPVIDSAGVTIGGVKLDGSGLTIAGGPSVTNAGINAGDQVISNVAPGVDGSDAVNVDQLGEVRESVNRSWNVSANGEDEPANVAPDGTVDFSNTDGNILIDRDGTDLAFSLNSELDLSEEGRVTIGGTEMDDDGVRVGDNVQLGEVGLVIAGGPSVTDAGIDAGDQVITSVAAGEVSETSTDAINGSQLYAVQNIAESGWSLSGSGENAVNIGPNGAVDFQGDSNITVSQAGVDQDGVIEVALNDSITLGEGDNAVTVDGENGRVSVGDTIMNGDGISVGDDVHLGSAGLVINGGPSVTTSGIDAGGMRITNLMAGVEATDAVNVSQLNEGVAAATTEVTAGSNISVSESTGDNGQTIYTVETQRDVNFDSIEVGTVNIDQNNVDENGNTIITGVGRGEVSENSTDAVNGSQLWDVQQELGDINESLDGGMNFAADEGDAVNRRLGDTIAVSGDDNITTRTTGDGVQVTMNRDLDVDSVTTGRTTVSDQGVTIDGGPSMTVDGIDGGGMRITNVAPGVDATDAVNVGQMQELNQRFANEINNVHGRIDNVKRNANAGTASALAAGTVPQAWMPGKSMVGVGAGTYEGESAVSVGVSRLSDNGRWIIQGKVTGDSQSNFGAGVGAGWHW
jgi:autotransporter adhesin